MDIGYKLDGGPELVFRTSLLTGSVQLYVDGIREERIDSRTKWQVTMQDGSRRSVEIKNNLLFWLSPVEIIEGRDVLIGRKLTRWEYVLCLMPLMLCLIGGAVGALLGVLAFFINTCICRTRLSDVHRIVLTLAVTACTVLVYAAAASMIRYVFN